MRTSLKSFPLLFILLGLIFLVSCSIWENTAPFAGVMGYIDPELIAQCKKSDWLISENPALITNPKILILEIDDLSLHDWHFLLPDQWRAAYGTEVDYLVCLRESAPIIEKCTFESGHEVIRKRSDLEVVVFEPSRDEANQYHHFLGELPPPCPESSLLTRTFTGARTPYSKFETWLEIQFNLN